MKFKVAGERTGLLKSFKRDLIILKSLKRSLIESCKEFFMIEVERKINLDL